MRWAPSARHFLGSQTQKRTGLRTARPCPASVIGEMAAAEVRYGLVNRERVQCYVVGSNEETDSLVLALPWQPSQADQWLEFKVNGLSVRMVEVPLQKRKGLRIRRPINWEDVLAFPTEFEPTVAELQEVYADQNNETDLKLMMIRKTTQPKQQTQSRLQHQPMGSST